MFSGRWELPRDKDGRFFIDRDPALFKEVVNLLRKESDALTVPIGKRERVRRELVWYGLDKYIRLPSYFSESAWLSRAHAEALRAMLVVPSTKATLLYSGSRDGWNRATFHARCDGHGKRARVGVTLLTGYLTISHRKNRVSVQGQHGLHFWGVRRAGVELFRQQLRVNELLPVLFVWLA